MENRTADLALTNLAPESDLFRRRMLGSDPILLAAAYDKRMQQRFPEQCGNITSPIPIDSVSYTHLDVYKRQELP